MIAFSAIAIVIITLIPKRIHSGVEQLPRPLDLGANFRQIRQFKRRTIFLYQVNQGDTVKLEVIVLKVKTFLRKIEGLIN